MTTTGWQFIGDKGDFFINNPTDSNYLYFPLVNEAGMMSSITPTLHGDINTGQNSFATEPVSAIDLINNKASRNFWLLINDKEVWSATGYSAQQEVNKSNKEYEQTRIEAGMLWHKLIVENYEFNIKSEITNFVPVDNDQVELMKVTIKNTGEEAVKISPTSAIPLYGRSADNLRDHRHVTSLLNEITTVDTGVVLTPTLSFDERGHQRNNLSYQVVGKDDQGKLPIGYYPVFEDFIGEGGSLTWPQAIVNQNNNFVTKDQKITGYEAMGALRFEEVTLKPNHEKTYLLAIGVQEKNSDINLAEKYCQLDTFENQLEKNKEFWQGKVNKAKFNSADKDFDHWMKWITIQPTLRRYYGNSFLPHHDYGRGGRGWRDLWQDCLALLLMEPEPVREMLFNNFAGVRIDGSNATIIGSKPGEFIADRNGISRVWMDHGAWPFLTTKLYIDRTGDLDILFEKQTYFRDEQLNRSKKFDASWKEHDGNELIDQNNNTYKGTILEHLLIQHLSIFFNVGDHNNLQLEGGDWNDGLDMGEDQGESVAFTGLYGKNMLAIAKILKKIQQDRTIETIEIAKEMMLLLDSLTTAIDYNDVELKREVLNKYLTQCEQCVSGEKINININDLILDLERKGQWILNHIRNNEWIEDQQGYQWYNAYYDNDGQRVEGDHPLGTRMTLTGQVFSIMSDVATDEQIDEIIKSSRAYLLDEAVGGYRLNTNFNEVKLNMGRAFGFAYGEKENGAMFSHMAVMYSNALYQRNFVNNGFEVIKGIYNHCKDFDVSRIYPGIPEYIDSRGRGLYHYLTGSASWFLLTMVDEVYGIKGEFGNLKLAPKLTKEQFDQNKNASIDTIFANQKLKVIYNNHKLKESSDYRVGNVKLNGEAIKFSLDKRFAIINRDIFELLEDGKSHILEVNLV